VTDWLERLEALRERVGGTEKSLSIGESIAPFIPIEVELKTTGVGVTLEDIQRVGPYITYRGEHLAILYILNSNASSSDLESNDPAKRTPRFHLTWCEALEGMMQKERFDRYVLSRSESNLFRVESEQGDMLEDIRLFPCQYCLVNLQYRGFRYKQPYLHKEDQVRGFNVKTFLEENDGNLPVMKHLPKTLAESATAGDYTKDFPEISRRLREYHNWTCEECGIDMTGKKEGLHTHHVNGVKSDNSRRNLRVLCALCHRNVDQYHKHMRIKPDILRYIQLKNGGIGYMSRPG